MSADEKSKSEMLDTIKIIDFKESAEVHVGNSRMQKTQCAINLDDFFRRLGSWTNQHVVEINIDNNNSCRVTRYQLQ